MFDLHTATSSIVSSRTSLESSRGSQVSSLLVASISVCIVSLNVSTRPLARETDEQLATPSPPDSLVVCRTEVRDLSRMCIVLKGQDGVVEQARRQLEDLVSPSAPCSSLCSRSDIVCVYPTFLQVPVWAVLDYTQTSVIQRELLLVKISTLGFVVLLRSPT